MQIATANLLQYLSPLRWAGPIFDKELRVASRRRRLYLLRFAYVVLLAFFVGRVWYAIPHSGGSGSTVVQTSRLGEMGKQIVCLVVWFQFITGQILAAVLLSDAIGSEVRQRTLDVLLVTPVRSVQIVIGKLLSKLLQLVSLLAVSLPVLAVVRVFGGVPWDYVVASLCITLSAGMFAGALSLFCSITDRHPYHAVLTVGLWYLVVWGLTPMVLTALSTAGYAGVMTLMSILRMTNPLVALGDLTQGVITGSGTARVLASWPWLCLILLALAGVLLAWSVWRVRRTVRRARPTTASEVSDDPAAQVKRRWGRQAIRPVTGSPIVWKERCTPLFRTRRRGLLFAGLVMVAVGIAIVLCLAHKGVIFPVAYSLIQIVRFLFVIDLAVAAAGAVTKEREARTWPILLATPLDAGEIIRGKAIGVFRRNLPLLLPLPVLYLLVWAFSPHDSRVLWQLPMGIILPLVGLAATTFMLLGTGLYFSTRLKTTAAAVGATFAVYIAPKFLCCGFLSPLVGASPGVLGMLTASGGPSLLYVLMVTIAPVGVYVGVGLLFMRLAARRVRRDVF